MHLNRSPDFTQTGEVSLVLPTLQLEAHGKKIQRSKDSLLAPVTIRIPAIQKYNICSRLLST